MAYPHLPWVRDREEISLPRSVINQIINEVVPDVEVSKESRELIFSCCTEFMFLLSAEANEVSNSQQKKTIDAEHVLHALDRLGFADFRIDAEEVVTQCKVIAARRRMKNIRFKNIGIPEEELLRVQQELFAKGDHKSHGLTTNNCRYETLLSSKLYASPFNKGNRCVVICDGFYEWQTTKGKGSKQPYFIYMSQDEGVRVEDAATWSSDWNEEDGWKGPKLLHMAGIFDVWNTPEGDQIYSYSVITLESNDTLSWLHHRMPAILEGDQQVADWLDVKRVQAQEAAAMIHPVAKVLSWHAVATLVNNSRNKDPQCNKPITLEKPKSSKGQMLMQSWLKKGTVKRESQEVRDDMPDDGSGDGSLAVKKVKTDTLLQ